MGDNEERGNKIVQKEYVEIQKTTKSTIHYKVYYTALTIKVEN